MIGLLIITTVFVYVLLAKWVVKIVYRNYSTKKAKNIALAIMILIPTWDIILGYPIYKYLCLTKAGVHIYKTVDNVEGFYIGDWNSQGYSKVPPIPSPGYRYVDYHEVHYSKPTGKYFRTTWMDVNATKECIKGIGFPNDYNAKLVKSGKCIVKKEISEGEVIGLWKISKKVFKNYSILYLHITSVLVEVIDPRTNEKYFTAQDYMVDKSWITMFLNMVTDDKSRYVCNGIAYNVGNSISHYAIESYIFKNQGEKHGND